MNIVYMIVVSGVIFLAGVFFIIRGLRKEKESAFIVPITDPDEIKQLHQQTSHLPEASITQVQEKPKLKVHVQDPTPTVPVVPTSSQADLPANEDQLNNLKAEIKRLNDALTREMSSKQSAISQESQQRIKELEDSLSQNQKTLEAVSTEKNDLLTRVNEQARQLADLERRAAINEKKDQPNPSDVNWKSEYEKLFEDAGKLKAKEQAMLVEIKSLKSQLSEKPVSSPPTPNSSAEQLALDKQMILVQLKKGQETIRELQTSIEYLKKTNDQKVFEAQANAANIEAKLHQLQQMRPSEIPSEERSALLKTIDELKNDKERIIGEKAQLELGQQKIKEFNEHLLSKERLLQYELTKSRAETIGLAKICEEFKIQIENLSKGAGNDVTPFRTGPQ